MTPSDGPAKDGLESAFRPEDDTAFRLAQLLLLLEVIHTNGWSAGLDRLGMLDFFAANPFLIVNEDDPAYKRLVLAGFAAKPITYASPGQRFATRRSRIQHDLSLLVSYELAKVEVSEGFRTFVITPKGISVSLELKSLYADSYRSSAEIIGSRLHRLSDKKLQENCRSWLRADPALLDLYGN
ncbi:ABC-three component system middle component 2 [Streptomyces phaeochromogenes]|uniref:ABC-three component system middle component 2 n=1 Tax=Streptomyces phaeochromogenes TaxID=1923 RepID=UPI003406CD1F